MRRKVQLVSAVGTATHRRRRTVSALLVASSAAFSGCDEATPRSAGATWHIGVQGTQAGHFVEPRALAASPHGKLFVIDRTGRVQRFNSSGRFEHTWEMPDNRPDVGKPSGIGVDGSGNVLVADTHQHRVIVFDQDGQELLRFGEKGLGPGQLFMPTDVVVDRTGSIYVSQYGINDRISKFDSTGRYLFSFGDLACGTGALQRPSGLACDNDGHIWVADTSNHRVCCFDSRGRLLRTFGTLGTEPGKLRYPRDVGLLDDGTLLVVDYGNDRIARFDQQGVLLGTWGRAGRGEGELHSPINVAVLDEHLAIADSRNHRVVLYTRNSEQLASNAVADSCLARLTGD